MLPRSAALGSPPMRQALTAPCSDVEPAALRLRSKSPLPAACRISARTHAAAPEPEPAKRPIAPAGGADQSNHDEPQLKENKAMNEKTKPQSDDIERHDREVRAVMSALAKLTTPAAPHPCRPEAVFEGAIKGAAATIMAHTDATAADVADLLENIAHSFRDLARPNLHVVQ
ncbi:hypothetical protein [Oricola sp.]|uniref:hypothetical protein n=1 Tax=Oricola sp. TaxID=1979950 RepID=UPI0025F83D2D|nr:hypothetical protein [Oricola sp.]MCI5078250.1 hypothetical protein [Oricola sp.]